MSEQDNNLKQTTTVGRMHGLMRLLDGLRGFYLMAVASVGLAAIARVGIFAILAYFIDNVLPSDNIRARLPLIILGLVALAVGQGIFTFAGGRWAAHVSEHVARRIRNYLYDHIQRLSFTYHDTQPSGELLQKATSDVDTIRRLFAEQALAIGRITFLFVVNFVALVWISWRLALGSIVVIPFVLGVAVIFFRVIEKRYGDYQEQNATVTNRLQENLHGVRVVKAFAMQEHETAQFHTESKKLYDNGVELTKAHSLFWPSTDVLCGLQNLAGYVIGARMVMSGDISLGLFIASMAYIQQIIWPIRHLGRTIADFGTALVSFGRIADIIRENREPLEQGSQHPALAPSGAITFDAVGFAYENEPKPVLEDISFSVSPGETVAVLGSTGSGKTSLVNLLMRFYEYTEGSIRLDGLELNDVMRKYLREHIGIVMQESFLFATTIRENIAYGVDNASQEAIEEAAKAAAIHDVILGFPDGYDTVVGERGVTLSGGQKQRTALARTILQNPPILVLDDASSAVDTETESRIRAALAELSADRTTFIIAHRIQSVMHADLILVMDEGRIIQRGTHQELVSREGTYRRIYELQSSIEAELEAELADFATV